MHTFRYKGHFQLRLGHGDWRESLTRVKSTRDNAISADGQFLIASERERVIIHSAQVDADEPIWEPSNKAEGSECYLLEYEYISHVSFSPSGSLIAAGSNYETVFVWDDLDTSHASKQTLGHTEFYVHNVRISPDGLQLAGRDIKNNVIIWTRSSIGAKFEFPITREFDSDDAASDFLESHSLWAAAGSPGAETRAAADLSNTEIPESATSKLCFVYKDRSEWVTRADGKKLWWLPEHFRGYLGYKNKIAQMGDRIAVYCLAYVVVFELFEFKDGGSHSGLLMDKDAH